VTVKVRGVVRVPVGETVSHVRPPLVPDALAEKLTALESLTARDP